VTNAKLTPSVERSILKPASLLELSVHVRLIRVELAAVACNAVGAAGGCGAAGPTADTILE
jgi:hypothetical protein